MQARPALALALTLALALVIRIGLQGAVDGICPMTADTPIRGFATICCLGHYRAVTAELVDALMDSRLYDRIESMELAVLGSAEDQDAIEEMVRPFDKLRIGHRSTDVTEFEFPALGLLQDACRSWSGNVFYVHTKGVSSSVTSQHERYWRALMLDQVVRNHQTCTELLQDHDTVGTNWRGNHYSGNFWWARSDHVRRLPNVRVLRNTPRPICAEPVWNVRLQCEFWLGTVAARFANLGANDLDLYHTIRWTMDASAVVNDLLAALGGDRYAEIVMGGPSPYFGHVTAGAKDSFDRSLGPPSGHGYDVILVDAWHDERNCLEDLTGALGMLRDRGAVVVHDTNPPTAWHQRDGVDYEPGTEWNGTAWRAVHRFRRDHPDTWVQTVDTDWGCTVIIPGLAAPLNDSAPETLVVVDDDQGPSTWEWFEQNRDRALGLISPRRYRRLLYTIPYALGHRAIATRTEVLNCLVSLRGLERYLEIGVGGGENFAQVIAPVRHSVDPEGHRPTFQMTSDDFFASGRGCPEYDLVFIDGLHEEEQVLRDIENALARLSSRGRIVLHDANPPTAWHQRPMAEYQLGQDWNGAVWKAVVRFRELHPELSVVTLDVDWGCTMIRRGDARQPDVGVLGDLTWDFFAERREELLNLRPPLYSELIGN